jgi:hypothetical protein
MNIFMNAAAFVDIKPKFVTAVITRDERENEEGCNENHYQDHKFEERELNLRYPVERWENVGGLAGWNPVGVAA